MIYNSVGSNMFRNLYVFDESGSEYDAADNGDKSCALFVTGILKMFNRIDNLHSTASGTYKYISESPNWTQTDSPQPGDVIFWDKTADTTGHVGFYIGEKFAISNDYKTGQPQQHKLKLYDGREPMSYWRYKEVF